MHQPKNKWIDLKAIMEVIFLLAGLGFLTVFFFTRDSFYGIIALFAFQLVAMLWARQDACNNGNFHSDFCDKMIKLIDINIQREKRIEEEHKTKAANGGQGLRAN